jgi:hypothetical protein
MTKKRREKRRDRDTWKRFLDTIVSLLPSYIARYPPTEQIILTEFLNVIESCDVSTSVERETLSKKMGIFINKYHMNRESYFGLPFLWFTIDYFSNARRILSVEGFYASDFYHYLVHHLRQESETTGAFFLIQKRTPLTDKAWEDLQYACNKLVIPLTRDQVEVLSTVFHYIRNIKPSKLNQQTLKAAITRKVRNSGFSRHLPRFFTLLDAQWNLRFYPAAFGLELVYFNFQVSEPKTLFDIIDFNDPANSTLGATTVYRIGKFNTFCGIIYLPSGTSKLMKTYLKQCEHQGLIMLQEFIRIVDAQKSNSLALYESEKGWRDLNPKEKQKLGRQIKNQINLNEHLPSSTFFLSPPFYTNWHFQKNKECCSPTQLIALYCKFHPSFSYTDMNSSMKFQNKYLLFLELDQEILTSLYHKKVVQISLNPIRLFKDFSLNSFWIEVPQNVKMKTLMVLLSILPTATIYTTETDSFQIWTVLTPKIYQWISRGLEWKVHSVRYSYWGKNLDITWFDPKSLEWKVPSLLKR